MARILIVSKTSLGQRVCIGGIDMDDLNAVRMNEPGHRGQPADTTLDIGDVWEAQYIYSDGVAPHTEDANVNIHTYLGETEVEGFVTEQGIPVLDGLLSDLFEGRLRWTASGSGYLEPREATPYSTCFWRPEHQLDANFVDKFVEAGTGHHVRWKGVATPPTFVLPGTLCRISLATPWHPGGGEPDHDVCFLQLSGVY